MLHTKHETLALFSAKNRLQLLANLALIRYLGQKTLHKLAGFTILSRIVRGVIQYFHQGLYKVVTHYVSFTTYLSKWRVSIPQNYR